MATYAVAIAVLGIVAWYGRVRTDEMGQNAAAAALIALNLLALIALGHEIADYYAWQMAELHPTLGRWTAASWAGVRRVEIARDFTYSALGMGYGAGLMIVGLWRRSAFVRWQALVLIAATIVKVFTYDVSELDRAYRILSFIVLGVLLLANFLRLPAQLAATFCEEEFGSGVRYEPLNRIKCGVDRLPSIETDEIQRAC